MRSSNKIIMYFNFVYRLDCNFKNNKKIKTQIDTNQFINVPAFDYHLDRLLILTVLVLYQSFVDIKKNLRVHVNVVTGSYA